MLSPTKVEGQEPLSFAQMPYKVSSPVLMYSKESGLLAKSTTIRGAYTTQGENEAVDTDDGVFHYDLYDWYEPYTQCETCRAKYPPNWMHVCELPDIETNSLGGSQSKLEYAFTEFEPDFLFRVAAVLKTGRDKYGHKNWTKIPFEDHINHAFYHLVMAQTDDETEDHLANLVCRAMFAMHTKFQSQQPQTQEHHQ